MSLLVKNSLCAIDKFWFYVVSLVEILNRFAGCFLRTKSFFLQPTCSDSGAGSQDCIVRCRKTSGLHITRIQRHISTMALSFCQPFKSMTKFLHVIWRNDITYMMSKGLWSLALKKTWSYLWGNCVDKIFFLNIY